MKKVIFFFIVLCLTSCVNVKESSRKKQIEFSRSLNIITYSESFSSYQQQVSNICRTPQMWCRLYQYGPIGYTCWCNTPYGPIQGRLVPGN